MEIKKELKEKLWEISLSFPKLSKNIYTFKKNTPIKTNELFSDSCEKFILELGSGWGEVAIELALTNPNFGFVLMEKKASRIDYTLKKIEEKEINNIRIIPINFNWFLCELFEAEKFDEVILNFPDPWPKNKHHKHRTVNLQFLDKLHYLLKPKGLFRFATDHEPYAKEVIRLFDQDERFDYKNEKFGFSRPSFPKSIFEMDSIKINRKVYYIERYRT